MNNPLPLQARVERILPEGEALARTYDGQSYRLRHAVPDDIITLSPLKKQRGVTYAQLETVVVPSPLRVPAACPVAQTCGGCALQYVHSDAHASIKSAWVQHAFASALQAQTDWQPVLPLSLMEKDKRRRVRWQVKANETGVHLGFFAYQSHDVVASEHCMVLTDALNTLRKSLEHYFSTHTEHPNRPKSVYAVQLHDGVHVVLEYEHKLSWEQTDLPQSLHLPVQYWQRCGHSIKPLAHPPHIFHDDLPSQKKRISLQIGADDFVQGQQSGNETMIQQILAWSQGAKRVVDLFSGVGNLSLPLAAAGMRVLGAEVNIASVRAANANAKRLHLDAHYEQADLFQTFEIADFVGTDVLLLDPPRKGARNICRLLPRLMPQMVILIHCDVGSARGDALEMLKQGYRLKALKALDLFPYSGHVESMSLWVH